MFSANKLSSGIENNELTFNIFRHITLSVFRASCVILAYLLVAQLGFFTVNVYSWAMDLGLLCACATRTKDEFHWLNNTIGYLPLRACTCEELASNQSYTTKNTHQGHAFFGVLPYVTRLRIFTVPHNRS